MTSMDVCIDTTNLQFRILDACRFSASTPSPDSENRRLGEEPPRYATAPRPALPFGWERTMPRARRKCHGLQAARNQVVETGFM